MTLLLLLVHLIVLMLITAAETVSIGCHCPCCSLHAAYMCTERRNTADGTARRLATSCARVALRRHQLHARSTRCRRLCRASPLVHGAGHSPFAISLLSRRTSPPRLSAAFLPPSLPSVCLVVEFLAAGGSGHCNII